MAMFGWSVFYGNSLTFRSVWLSGRQGGGKTALAVRLAYQMLKDGHAKHVVSNIPISFGTDVWSIEADEGGRLHTVVLLDEGGLFLNNSAEVRQFTSFMRKSNVYLIISSVEPPALSLRTLSVERVQNGFRYGLNGWQYRYLLKTQHVKESEKFVWWNPKEIFGIYDTDARPVDDMGIGDWLNYHKEIQVKKYYEDQGKQLRAYEEGETTEDGVRAMAGQRWFLEQLAEATELLQEATISIHGEKRQSGRR